MLPGEQHTSHDDPALMAAVEHAAAQNGLLPCKPFVRKCLHLSTTLASRFGVMLIGAGGAGKSSLISTLCSAHNALLLGSANPDNPAAPAPPQPVRVTVINPKACVAGDLYGQHSDATGEWREGVISASFRAAMAVEDPPGPGAWAGEAAGDSRGPAPAAAAQKTWVVLDGPIDSAWVENLNTVLDDTRTLCLASGERMQLSARRLNVVFEVDGLSAASPATVSRCGMVFVAEEMLTWREVVGRWLQSLPACMGGTPPAPAAGPNGAALDTGVIRVPPMGEFKRSSKGIANAVSKGDCSGDGDELLQLIEFLMELFEEHVEAGLNWLERHVDEAVRMSAQQRVSSMCLWLQVLLRPEGGWSYADGFGVAERAAVSCMFAFAFVWGLGGGLRGDCRAAWDSEVRRRFDGTANFPERAGTVYEYCCNPERNFTFQVRPSALPVHPL